MNRTGKKHIKTALKAVGIVGAAIAVWTAISVCAVYFGKPTEC